MASGSSSLLALLTVFEPYADDWEDQDQWNRTFVKILNMVQAGRGWVGWAQDIVKASLYSLGLGR